MKKLKQLAKEAYNSKEVCQEWKDKILEAYPEVKPKLEVGKWYKYNGCVLNYQGENKEGVIQAYGVVRSGLWFDKDNFGYNHEEWCLATEKEVSEALIKEAKRRGFKKGCKIINSLNYYDGIMSGKYPLGSENEYYYSLYDDWIFVNRTQTSNICIYEKGKWAEIIKQEPEEIKVTYEEVKPKVIELDGVKYRLTEIKK